MIIILSDSESNSRPNWTKRFLFDIRIPISCLLNWISIGFSNFWELKLLEVTDFKYFSYKIRWWALSWFTIIKPDLVLFIIYFLFNWIVWFKETSLLISSKSNSFNSLLSDENSNEFMCFSKESIFTYLVEDKLFSNGL